MLKRNALTALAVATLCASTAVASNENPFLGADVTLNWNGEQAWSMSLDADDSTSTGSIEGMMAGTQNPNWDLELTNVFFDADPIISANAAVTNTTGVTQTFNLVFSMPVNFATGGSTTHSGSMSLGITDANGDSTVTMGSVAPDAVYRAFVNGVEARTLFDDPYSLSASGFPAVGGGDVANFGTEAGPAEALLTELRLEYTFTLSPGDRAVVTGAYFIIPEPATLSMLAFGSLALIRRKR